MTNIYIIVLCIAHTICYNPTIKLWTHYQWQDQLTRPIPIPILPIIHFIIIDILIHLILGTRWDNIISHGHRLISNRFSPFPFGPSHTTHTPITIYHPRPHYPNIFISVYCVFSPVILWSSIVHISYILLHIARRYVYIHVSITLVHVYHSHVFMYPSNCVLDVPILMVMCSRGFCWPCGAVHGANIP